MTAYYQQAARASGTTNPYTMGHADVMRFYDGRSRDEIKRELRATKRQLQRKGEDSYLSGRIAGFYDLMSLWR